MTAATKISPRDTRRLRDFISRFVDGTEGFRSEEAEYLLSVLSPRRRPSKSLSLPGKTKEQRKAERREHIAKVRAEAFEKWSGMCVPCFYEVEDDAQVQQATDLHHLCSGGGTRQAEERTGTVLPVCRTHHNLLHAGEIGALRITVHIARDPFAEVEDVARRAVERRLEKAESFEARRSTEP